MDKCFETLLAGLNDITKECREDMHEPDEQGIYAEVKGDHLDNAFGEDQPPIGEGEFVVRIINENTNKSFYINLASLIALARKAKI